MAPSVDSWKPNPDGCGCSNYTSWGGDADYRPDETLFADGHDWRGSGMNGISAGAGLDAWASYSYSDGIERFNSSGAVPTDWGYDPSMGSLMGASKIETTGGFTAASRDVEIAVAGLEFGGDRDQVCDFTGSVSSSGSYSSSSYESSMASSYTGNSFDEDRNMGMA